ncbi:MAG: HD-GYP domain-containing protein [Gaiellaceae bacterium]
MLATLSQAIDACDPYTDGHSARVTAVAESIAARLGWSEERLFALRIGGRLHDVGKLAVAAEVLRKPGRLTEAEFEQIREHPRAGARIIDRLGCFRAALPYVLYHHERWDGEGYPTGKAGEEIPVEARVLAVADAFDAMTSARSYRAPLTVAQALAEIDRCSGTQFDPGIAGLFLELWENGAVAAAG